jgi:hypothetical protein
VNLPLDTNQVTQVAQTVTAIQTQFNWPAIAPGALWLRADLAKAADYAIAHGGVVKMAIKVFWNPPNKVASLTSDAALPPHKPYTPES